MDAKSFTAGVGVGIASFFLFNKCISEFLKPAETKKDRKQFWQSVLEQITVLLDGKDEKIMCTGNAAALIYHELRNTYGPQAVNWCGFYLVNQPVEDLTESTIMINSGEPFLSL